MTKSDNRQADWLRRLTTHEMPVLAKVVSELNHLTGNDETEVSQLSDVILRDPHLTSQVLRIANSVRYNPREQEINTVTRAIVLIGFNGIRAICISLMVIENLLGKKPRTRLLSLMARAFHGATQARAISQSLSHEDREEVFIATLLYNLGQMAFFAYGKKSADQLEQALDKQGNVNALAIKALGLNFKELSKSLGIKWRLGPVLQEALSDSKTVSAKAQAVRLGDNIALTLSEPSDKEGLKDTLGEVGRFTGLSLMDTKALVDSATEESAKVALSYGVPEICQLIPKPSAQTPIDSVEDEVTILEPDSRLQLKILRELSMAVSEALDINVIFRMVLEGMHRGIGLERVVLAFFKKDTLTAKYTHGQGTDGWLERFEFKLNGPQENIFDHASKQRHPVWLGEKKTPWDKELFTPNVASLIERRPNFIGVLRISSRNASLFYADRGATGEALSKEQFDSFSHFISQAQTSLEAIARR
ncbi:HDOD domain-containing protein [bacterium]|nr:HDOD domain-containing protein [bacterium]